MLALKSVLEMSAACNTPIATSISIGVSNNSPLYLCSSPLSLTHLAKANLPHYTNGSGLAFDGD